MTAPSLHATTAAIGLPIIISVGTLSADFYGERAARESHSSNSGPADDASLIGELFVDQASRAAGMQQPLFIGDGHPGAVLSTRAEIIRAISDAATRLTGDGDTLFLYFAGHGARLDAGVAGPDPRNVLCLTDGMLMDVELIALWRKFAPQSRVIMFADCCHAGDIASGSLVQRILRSVRLAATGKAGTAVRSLMDDLVGDIANNHADALLVQYVAAAAAGGTDRATVPCALMEFAASSPEDVILTDDKGRSPFTVTLVSDFYLNRKKYKGYTELADDVIRDIDTSSNPMLTSFGRQDTAFEHNTPPFTV